MTQPLIEKGRVISAANERRLRAAIATVQEVLAAIDHSEEPDEDETEPVDESGSGLVEVIRKEGNAWVLYSEDGTKRLGRFDTREEAEEREREIKALLHAAESGTTKLDVTEALTQSVDGVGFPASDFAYVPDPEKPSTWKLRLTKEPGGPPDPGIVGAACAALGKGFRGQRVDIPAEDLPAVKRKLRAAWRKANPDRDPEEMPAVIREAADDEILIDCVPLVEKAVGKDGTMLVKVIAPMWGSSGYYKPETLMRDGPKVFTRGTKMYVDHPTAREEAERPERSVRDLVAEFVEDAKYDSTGPFGPDGRSLGPGLYARAKVFKPWQPFVEELAPHIGVSIRALGKAGQGEAEGRKGPIIEGISEVKSVDLVTVPGAGGKITTLFESARTRAEANTIGGDEVDDATYQLEKEAREAAESEVARVKEQLAVMEAELARLREAEVLREARALVEAALPVELAEITKARLIETLTKNPPVKEGALDREVFQEAVAQAVAAEVEYITKISESGRIKGLGFSGSSEPHATLREQWKRKYLKDGYDEPTATRLAELATR